MQNFTKVIRPGTISLSERHSNVSVFCKIKFMEGKLSISGVEGPWSSGNCAGSCGQIDMHLTAQSFVGFANGWNAGKTSKLLGIWKLWHLNDLTAGSPNQEEYLKANPVVYAYPETHYGKACKMLTRAGLNPDLEYIRDGKPYSYGHAWLHTDVPQDVLQWLKDLPDTDTKPAWV